MKDDYAPHFHMIKDQLSKQDLADITEFECNVVPMRNLDKSIITNEEIFGVKSKREFIKCFESSSSDND